jgi:Ca2+-binding EF-hand superfamily protein
VNFLEFVKLLAPFSGRVSVDDKLNFLFTVYDVDGDGAGRKVAGSRLLQCGRAAEWP